jgi:hypothetical protein
MRSTALLGALASLILAAGLFAGRARSADPGATEPCSGALVLAMHEAERQVDSLRPDKSGQARVFARDGSEFTAGQATWMKGQLQLAEQSCAKQDSATASAHVLEVQKLLKTHVPG